MDFSTIAAEVMVDHEAEFIERGLDPAFRANLLAAAQQLGSAVNSHISAFATRLGSTRDNERIVAAAWQTLVRYRDAVLTTFGRGSPEAVKVGIGRTGRTVNTPLALLQAPDAFQAGVPQHRQIANSIGMKPADHARLQALHATVSAVEAAQEAAKGRRAFSKQLVDSMNRNLQRMLDQVHTAGSLIGIDQPEVYQRLIGPKRTVRKKKEPIAQPA